MAEPAGKHILFLATDAHGAGGGIAQFNRDIIDALVGFDEVAAITILPRHGTKHPSDAPTKASYPKHQPQSRVAYIWLLIRTLFTAPHFDVIYCAHIRLLPLAWLAKIFTNAPIFLQIHGIDAWTPPSRWTSKVLKHIDGLASVSQITLDRLGSWAGTLDCPAHILPNTIDKSKFGIGGDNSTLANRLGIAGGPVIMTFGRMSASERYKGFDEVLHALPLLQATFPNIHYLLAGDGDDRMQLEKSAHDLGIEQCCIFTGYIPEAEKADHFRLADAYVMPSHGEGFGIVVLEALACGVPVVASTADGTFEALRGGMLGQTVDPQDQTALIAAITKAIQTPKAIPDGLNYFSKQQFSDRLRAAILPLLS
ncbi:MAG: glycosyltransferase family 4 protein [Pseudomonadota bacterium]